MAHATETSVKWYCNTMQGAGLANAATIFQRCLVDGFNLLTVDSVAVVDQIATVTRANGHGYLVDQIITVAGATPSGLNGEKRVLSVTLTTFTFDATGIADQTATGTITTKTSPAGWTMPFSSANRIVLRSANPLSLKSYYRIDSNSGNRSTRPFTAYGTMTGVDTGSLRWGGAATYMVDTDTQWVIVADDRTVYAAIYRDGSSTNLFGFGDFIPLYSTDAANEFISGMNTNSYSTAIMGTPDENEIHGEGTYVRADLSGNIERRAHVMSQGCTRYTGCRNAGNSGLLGIPVFPSTLDNGAVMTDALLRDNNANYGWMMRGKMRGYKYALQDAPVTWTVPPQRITGVSGLNGRVIAMVGLLKFVNAANRQGRAAMDITGPWG